MVFPYKLSLLPEDIIAGALKLRLLAALTLWFVSVTLHILVRLCATLDQESLPSTFELDILYNLY